MMLRKVSSFARDAALCRLMSGYGVTVVIQGDACPATDGKVIALPPLKLGADDIDIAIHDFGVGHEPSHITEGSFEVQTPNFLHDVVNWLEDIRCEDSQERTKYPGLRRERADFYANFKKYAKRLGTGKLIEAASNKAEAVHGALCLFLLEARGSQLGVKHNVKPSPAVKSLYDTTLAQFRARAEVTKSAHETLVLGEEIQKALYGAIKQAEEVAEGKKPLGPGGYSPFAGLPGPSGEKTINHLEKARAPTVSQQVLDVITTTANASVPQPLAVERIIPKLNKECFVKETLAYGIKMLGTQGSTMTRLLMANSRPRTVRGRIDGRLDVRAVTEDHLDVRRNLYTHRVRGAADVAAVSFLIDVSGSMCARAPIVFSVVLGLGYYLERARVPFEIAGFDDSYWPLKGWDEPMKGKAFLRLAPFSAGGTNLAGAMRMASRTLMVRPERRKVLFVLSDGAAGNLGYCIKLSKAMRKDGAVVVGIGLGCNLSGIFGEADSVELPVKNTGEYLVKRLTKILSRKESTR